MLSLQRQKMCLQTFASNVDSDQPAHLLGAFWIANDIKLLHAGKEDSDQTARF